MSVHSARETLHEAAGHLTASLLWLVILAFSTWLCLSPCCTTLCTTKLHHGSSSMGPWCWVFVQESSDAFFSTLCTLRKQLEVFKESHVSRPRLRFPVLILLHAGEVLSRFSAALFLIAVWAPPHTCQEGIVRLGTWMISCLHTPLFLGYSLGDYPLCHDLRELWKGVRNLHLLEPRKRSMAAALEAAREGHGVLRRCHASSENCSTSWNMMRKCRLDQARYTGPLLLIKLTA
mmetsp:Transcript_4095/g.7473  ORF Transcript_4095/g.7473 Transcript_4095/m.7473 type:complete len:233 (-) Transcript_4095:8-706(-)